MLLARQEPVGELAVSSIAEPPGIGWRIQQGDTVLELTQSPLQLFVYRGEECILTTPEGSLTYDRRSEEHTSELQSLMRNSYAVFCLKQKTRNTTTLKNR